MFCRFCGNKISDDSVFCPCCGKQLARFSGDSNAPSGNAAKESDLKEFLSTDSGKKILYACVGLFLLFAVFFSVRAIANSPSHIKYTITLDPDGGSTKVKAVQVRINHELPTAEAPTKYDYTFMGYYDYKGGQGTQFYDSKMNPTKLWDRTENATLYAHWLRSPTQLGKYSLSSFFDLEQDMEWDGRTAKITYSLKPKSNAYAKSSGSSDTITVKLKPAIYSGWEAKDPIKSKEVTVTLKKSSNYTFSGSTEFSYSSDSYIIHYYVDVLECTGTISEVP